jgi:hypothetical protein
MEFTAQKANQVIQDYELSRSAFYHWKKTGQIPDGYFTGEHKKPKPLTSTQRDFQERILELIQNPILLNTAFDAELSFQGKVAEMLSLRKGAGKRPRKDRPNLPTLNFREEELINVTNQIRDLAHAIKSALLLAIDQPYERRQETLKQLIKSRREITLLQLLANLPDEKDRVRWKNYMNDRRGVMGDQHKYIVAHIQSELLNLYDAIMLTLFYSPLSPAEQDESVSDQPSTPNSNNNPL